MGQEAPDATYTNFQRYLAAKKSVDDRALNQHVWHTLHNRLHRANTTEVVPLQVIEIGAGIGTMVERVLERGLLIDAHYTVVDAVTDNITTAKQRLPQWATANGFVVAQERVDGTTIRISRAATAMQPAVQVTVDLVQADCFDFAARPRNRGNVDLLIAHALLDLFDIPRALAKLAAMLKPMGLFYATINFDGNTILQPEIDHTFDDQLEAAYHATMDARITDGLPSGDSRSGRHLFGHLRDAGLAIVDAGSSDWVVFDGGQGYPADEAYFLHFIVATMHGALAQNSAIDQARFARWIQKRHDQIERGALVYIAHQLDFLAQWQ